MPRKKKQDSSDKGTKEKPTWLKQDIKEVEAIIVKLAKQGLGPEKIGLVLRDEYGIPTAKLFGKKIGQILKENNLYKDSDMEHLTKKEEIIKKHLEKNKQDKKAGRAKGIINARIRKIRKYQDRKSKK